MKVRRAPQLGGRNLRNRVAFVSDTRFGTDAGRDSAPSSHQCVLVMACALGVAEAEGISQERSQYANVLKKRRFTKSTFIAGASSLMMDWMIESPVLYCCCHVLSSDLRCFRV